MSRRHFPATNRFVCNGFFCVKIFVSATEFYRRNMSQKIKSYRIFATYCGDKILLRRQRFSQKFSSTHEAICRCDVSPQRVAATSRPTCTHGVISRLDLLLQLVARPVHTEWSVASTCCFNLSPDLYTRRDMWPRLSAATCHLVLCTDLKMETHISDRCSYQIAFSVGTNAYTV